MMVRTVLVVLVFCAVAACNPSKRTTKVSPPPVSTPDKEQPKDVGDVDLPKVEETIDTIKVDEFDPNAIPDTDLPAGPEGAIVSLMMPFFSDRYTGGELPRNSNWALGYYAGAKLGMEALEAQGERAQLHVYDNLGNPSTTQSLVSDPELRNSHVVIAPYLTKNVRALIAPAKAANLPLVVPYSAASNLGADYGRFVQLNPGLLRHLDGMAQYLNDAYAPEQVVLVGLPTGEQNKEVSYLLRQQKVLSPNAKSWRTWQLETADVGMQDLNWEGKFIADKTTIFVFPIYRKPKIVLSFLSQLQIGRGENDATVLGMPQWKEFNQLDATIMEELQVKITSGFTINENDPQVISFQNRYVDRYGEVPPMSAYLGYDAVRYIVPSANSHGRNWPSHLPKEYVGLVTNYKVLPVYSGKAKAAGEEPSASYFENSNVQLMMYRNYAFEVMD